MAYPVFDLHCDTADRIGWATLDLDLRFTAGTDGYFPATKRIRKISTSSRVTPVPSRSQRSATRRGHSASPRLSPTRFPPPTPRASRRRSWRI